MNGQPASPVTTARDLFLAALEQPTPAERTAYLDRACGGDRSLREAVESLLRNHKDDGFLETPVVKVPSTEAVTRGSARPIPDPAATERPGDHIGRYKLLQMIGEGGAGTVYMAEQEEPVHRRVALKIIKPGMDSKSVIARFETERQALALMDHPNIAKVLDAGATETGRPYFVMELVRGIHITDYCDQNHLPTRQRLDLFIKVCQAIQHAHQKGIIHRDIKPSNILVTLHDGVPVPKIIDFGIAKAIDQRLTDKTVFTSFQAFIGTPAYMSPEQAEMSGLDIDTRTDIYSLGVLLYEMLTGKTPFDAKELLASGLDQMRRTIRERDPVRPSTLLSTMVDAEITTTAKRQQSEPAKLAKFIQGDLDWIVMKALEKDRTRRYETASALAMDVQRHLDNEPVLACPPSRFYQFQKFARRNRFVFAAASACAAALILGLALSTWQYLEKSAAYRRALEAERTQGLLRKEAERARLQAETQALAARRRAYAADMNLVQQALAANNLGRAQEVLISHRPQPGELDLRGWEWRHLWQHCQSDALFTLCQQSNEVHSLAVSHDGRWLAIGEANGDLSVWDLRARDEIGRWSTGRGRPLLCFSPTNALLTFNSTDRPGAPGGLGGPGGPGGPGGSVPERPLPPVGGAERPGFGRAPHRIRFWDPTTRRFDGELAVEGFCRGLSYSANGQTLMTFSGDKVTFWNMPERTQRTTVTVAGSTPFGPGMFGTSASASRDLTLAALALPGGKIQLLDLVTGKERWSAQAAEENVTAMTFSPDAKILATGAGFVESTIHLWDVATGLKIARLEGHRTWVCALLFWPDGETLASASGDQTICLWDLTNMRSFPARPEMSRPESPRSRGGPPRQGPPFRFRPPGPWVATLHPSASLRGHRLEVWSLALLPDNTTLVSGSKDGSVYVWDTAALRRDRTHFTLPGAVRIWHFAPDSQSILALDLEGHVVRWHGPDFQEKQSLIEVGTNTFNAVLSPDGRFLAAGTPKGTIQVWDLQQQTLLRELASEERRAFPLAFLAPSDHLVTQPMPGGTFREWDVATGREVRSWRTAPSPGFRRLGAFSPDGQWFLGLGDDSAGLLRNLVTGWETNLDLNPKQITQAAFSPNGKYFALTSRLGTGSLWETTPPRRIASLHGFLQGTSSAAFSPDGKRLAIGGDGNEAIKLWDVESHQELLTLEGEGSVFLATAFSPDGNYLASSNSKGNLHVWRAPAREEIEKLEARNR